jgi:hypothetical protein
MLNVFGSVDLFPLTGVTFPFVSSGGTSMIASWGMLAFLKAADTRQNASFAVRLDKKGEFDNEMEGHLENPEDIINEVTAQAKPQPRRQPEARHTARHTAKRTARSASRDPERKPSGRSGKRSIKYHDMSDKEFFDSFEPKPQTSREEKPLTLDDIFGDDER